MDTTALSVWHALLLSAPAEKQNALLSCLSPELADELKKTPPVGGNPRQACEPIESQLPHIHFSWLTPFMRSLPEIDIKLFLSSLAPEQAKGLKGALLLSNSLPACSERGKLYMQKVLLDQIASEDLVPPSCLPDHPLNCLLALSSDELNSLIDLLSMHDLSVEIRQIIETARLKEIHSVLSKPQMAFLKTLLHKKEAVAFKKMGLQAWKGNKEQLRLMLLQRGLNRIGKALYDCHPSLLWHLSHRLNAEKGQLLLELCTPLDHPRALPLLTDQIVELSEAIKNHNPPEDL